MATDYELLAQYMNRPLQYAGPTNLDVAKYILLNANPTPAPQGSSNTNSPSIMSRIFDILSRPNYAVANLMKGALKGEPSGEDIWKGLSGKEKTTFKDVLKNQGVTDPYTSNLLGFGLDVGLDPLTYAGGGIARGVEAIRNLRGANTAARTLDRTLGQQLLTRGEPLIPESFGLPAAPTREIPIALRNPNSIPDVRFPSNIGPQLPTIRDIRIAAPNPQLTLPLDLPRTTNIVSPPVGQALNIGNASRILPREIRGQIPIRFPNLNVGRTRRITAIANPNTPTGRVLQAVNDATVVNPIVRGAVHSSTLTRGSNLLDNAQLRNFDNFLRDFGRNSAQVAGASPNGVNAAGRLVRMALQSGRSAADLAIEHNSHILSDIVRTGRGNPQANQILTRALERDLGRIPQWAVNDNRAIESLMGRVATWWGQQDLRPLSLNAVGSSAATAATRGRVLNNLFRNYTAPEIHEAFRVAQGMGQTNVVEVGALANQIDRMMNNLVGRVSGTSVLTRSGVDMRMLNKWMGQYGLDFRFTNGRHVEDVLGGVHDYSHGIDWVNSWRTANITDNPQQFLFRIQQAMEQATREKALFDEIGERFGSRVPGNGFRTRITGYPYLHGYYFPEDIARQIPRVVRDWSIPAWHSNSPLLRQYDRVMSMWKTGVTIYRPSHHLRNLAGDIYLGWMDGVNTMKPYLLAARVQRSMRGAYTDLADVDRLISMGALSRNYGTPRPGEILFRNKSGVPFTAEQIASVAHQKGLLEHARTIEDIIDLGDQGRRSILNIRPFGGRVQTVARGASELINHNTRLAHFIDKVAKSRGKDLAAIFESASRRARKWHPTGLDLTTYEKTVLRRVIPFYAWIRKSVPLLLEGLVMNPGKVVIPSKLNQAIQGMMGVDTPGRDNPFPVDQMFPSWIRAQGLGPISKPEGFLGQFSANQPPGYAMAGVGLDPLVDLVSQINNPGQYLASNLSPAIRIPMELMTGAKSTTGEPITGPEAAPGAFSQYVGEQLPIYSAAQSLTGITPFGSQTKRAMQTNGSSNIENLVNFLTAAGIKGTGPYIRQAHFEKIQPGIVAKKAQKQDFLSNLRDVIGG